MSQITSRCSFSPATSHFWLLAGALFCAITVTSPAGGQSSGAQLPATRPATATGTSVGSAAAQVPVVKAPAGKAPVGKAPVGKAPVGKAPVAKAAGSKATLPPASATAKSELIDINHATIAQLRTIPGIGDAYAKKIVAGRPFANKSQLVSRNIIKPDLYDLIQARIIAKQ